MEGHYIFISEKPTAYLLQGTPAGWGVACLAGGDSETAENC